VLNRLPAFLGKSPCFRKKAYVAWGRPGGAPAAPGGSGILPVSKESDLPVSPLSLYDDLLQFEERLDFAPQDIIDFGLEDATHKLEPTDIKRAQDALEKIPLLRLIRSGLLRSSNCSRWACVPSSRRWLSGASTTLSKNTCRGSLPVTMVFCPKRVSSTNQGGGKRRAAIS